MFGFYTGRTKSFKQLTDELPFLYWWNTQRRFKVIPRRLNVGDALSPYIVRAVMQELGVGLSSRGNKLLAIGSVMNHARNGDVIWGTGFNSTKPSDAYSFTDLDVRAVRGPVTRDFLARRGIKAPNVFGDPGILASKYIPGSIEKKYDYTFIPHISESPTKYRADRVLETKGSVLNFISELTKSKLVLSSSLHGVILAESYGIPAILVINDNGEGIEKYHDYYEGTDRSSFKVCSSVQEALSTSLNSSLDVFGVQDRLLRAFPYEL